VPSRFDLVIFDCDGVLVDSESVDDGVVARLMSSLGASITPADVNRLTRGMADREMWPLLAREYGIEIPPEFPERYEREALAAFETSLQAMEGVHDVLQALVDAGTPICVASSGSHEKMDVTLRVTDLARFFAGHIFSATQVSNGKPAPDLFLLAAAQMGADPSRCAVIEDSHNGCKAGVAAGMTTFGYLPAECGDARIGALPIQTFGAMRELPALLGLDEAP
jgi:HAD superfamily hydrolase (TIGR01509 family)